MQTNPICHLFVEIAGFWIPENYADNIDVGKQEIEKSSLEIYLLLSSIF